MTWRITCGSTPTPCGGSSPAPSATREEVARLTAVSAPSLPPYPYGMVSDFCDVAHRTDLGTATADQR